MAWRPIKHLTVTLGVLLALVLTSCNIRVADGDAASRTPDISADGRYVAYSSLASNLVPGDTNGHEDVFVWDRTMRASVQVTEGDDDSYEPAISADGRYVAFTSEASDLVATDPSPSSDIFVWDRVTGVTIAISDGNSPKNPAISADGRYVAYESWDSELAPDDTPGIIDVFVWDRNDASTIRITDDDVMDSGSPSISADGQVAYATSMHYMVEDPPIPFGDIFVWDATTGTTTQVTDGNNDSGSPDISSDGLHVSFFSEASDLVPEDPADGQPYAYVWDGASGVIVRIGDGSRDVAISADGRHVAYARGDVFVLDRVTGITTQTTNGTGWCAHVEISGDGRYLTYHCDSPDVVPGDTNGVVDVFVWDQLHWRSPGP